MKVRNWLTSRKALITWAAVALAFILLTVLVSLTFAVVVLLFFVLLILDVDRGIPLAAALVFLLISSFLLALNQNSAAGVLANWAYYFLAIGIILQLIDYVRSANDKKESEA